MSYFRPSGVSETPHIEIIRWKIYKVTSELWKEQTIHLCGYNLTEGHGRVSSAIVQVLPKDRIVITESDREYKLVGDTGFDPDAAYIWGLWCLRNGIREFFDVSNEYM
jgi:hypothetical protein